jgi:predicted nucleotidyltransferase
MNGVHESMSDLHIPNLGCSMPNMGMKSKTTSAATHIGLSDALFSNTQQRVLAFLFGQPERSFFATELIGLAGGGSGAVQRELKRLEASGLVTVTPQGNRKHYQANPQSPIFAELCGIVQKTVGLAEPLRAALAPFTSQITAAFVYGSVAKRSDTAHSDIDLMLISDTLEYADLYAALEQAATALGRTINPTIYTTVELAKRIKQKNAFVERVLAQPKIWLLGNEDEFPAG